MVLRGLCFQIRHCTVKQGCTTEERGARVRLGWVGGGELDGWFLAELIRFNRKIKTDVSMNYSCSIAGMVCR